MSETKIDRVKPVRISNVPGYDETFTLDFNRDSVVQAESRGFEVDDVPKYPATKIPELFYYSTRMYHKKMTKTQTDKLLEAIGGLTQKVLERLIVLYEQALTSNNIIQEDEELEKNGVTVELE